MLLKDLWKCLFPCQLLTIYASANLVIVLAKPKLIKKDEKKTIFSLTSALIFQHKKTVLKIEFQDLFKTEYFSRLLNLKSAWNKPCLDSF